MDPQATFDVRFTNHITSDVIKKLIRAMNIPKGTAEKIKNWLNLIIYVKQTKTPSNYHEYLRDLLLDVEEDVLANKITAFLSSENSKI